MEDSEDGLTLNFETPSSGGGDEPRGGRHWNRSFLPVADPGVPSRRTAAERFAPPEDSSSTSPCGAQTEETMPSDGGADTHAHGDRLPRAPLQQQQEEEQV